MDAEELLRLKIRLLTEGATLPEDEHTGRKGGAGPVGARYFLLPNGLPCGIPIRKGQDAIRFGSASLSPTDKDRIWLYDNEIELELVPTPKFYNRTTSDGTPFPKIALLHGRNTLATTIYQHCRYWDAGLQCKFCTIPHSLSQGSTVLEKTPSQISEVVQAAESEGLVKSILLTTGTPDTEDLGGKRFVEIVKAIRRVSSLPIGVQIEPPLDLQWIERIHAAGVDAIGIHLESADSKTRAEVCPGKFEHADMDAYLRAWKFAVGLFGSGNVSTFILQGLGEDVNETISLVDELSRIGVLSVVAPVRPATGSQLGEYTPPYVGRLEDSMQFYKKIGHILFSNKLNPIDTPAGCHACGGCTPIQEAYDWASSI